MVGWGGGGGGAKRVLEGCFWPDLDSPKGSLRVLIAQGGPWCLGASTADPPPVGLYALNATQCSVLASFSNMPASAFLLSIAESRSFRQPDISNLETLPFLFRVMALKNATKIDKRSPIG